MSYREILLIVPLATLVLTIAALMLGLVRGRRARRLFVKETGLGKGDWNLLSEREQQKWIDAVRFEREADEFLKDYRKNRK